MAVVTQYKNDAEKYGRRVFPLTKQVFFGLFAARIYISPVACKPGMVRCDPKRCQRLIFSPFLWLASGPSPGGWQIGKQTGSRQTPLPAKSGELPVLLESVRLLLPQPTSMLQSLR